MMSDLIERAKAWQNKETVLQVFEKGYSDDHTCADSAIFDVAEILAKCIKALSPALPDDVAELTAWLDEYTADEPMHSAVNSHYKLRRILKMLERQALEIATLQAQVNELKTEINGETEQQCKERKYRNAMFPQEDREPAPVGLKAQVKDQK